MLDKKDLEAIGIIVDTKIKSALTDSEKRVDQKFVAFGKVVDQKFVAFGKVVDQKLKNAFGDFFEQVLAPYLEEHVEKRFDKLDERLDKHEIWLKNHERRIQRLERTTSFA